MRLATELRVMKCREILHRDFSSVRVHEPVLKAAQIMRERGVGFLPVLDENDTPVGAVTDRDITVRALADDREPASVQVGEVMTPHVIACELDDDVNVPRHLMEENGVCRVIVVDGGRLCGVLSLADLAEAVRPADIGQTFRLMLHREGEEYLRSRPPSQTPPWWPH